VQMYMPMTEYKDEEVDAVYETTEELLDKESKGKDSRLIMGGWNVVDREGKRRQVCRTLWLRIQERQRKTCGVLPTEADVCDKYLV